MHNVRPTVFWIITHTRGVPQMGFHVALVFCNQRTDRKIENGNQLTQKLRLKQQKSEFPVDSWALSKLSIVAIFCLSAANFQPPMGCFSKQFSCSSHMLWSWCSWLTDPVKDVRAFLLKACPLFIQVTCVYFNLILLLLLLLLYTPNPGFLLLYTHMCFYDVLGFMGRIWASCIACKLKHYMKSATKSWLMDGFGFNVKTKLTFKWKKKTKKMKKKTFPFRGSPEENIKLIGNYSVRNH